jgi:hypothetical protein
MTCRTASSSPHCAGDSLVAGDSNARMHSGKGGGGSSGSDSSSGGSCGPGTFVTTSTKAAQAVTTCVKCPTGAYAFPVLGTSSYLLLPFAPGKYSPSGGMSLCLSCSNGQHAPVDGSARCTKCAHMISPIMQGTRCSRAALPHQCRSILAPCRNEYLQRIR